MEFRILGPLEVLENGQPLPITGAKQRALLALLLLERNRVVSADRLIDELWAHESPDRRRNALQARISQLRKTLPDGVLVTRAPGYAITLEPSELDLSQFEELLGQARRAREDGDIEGSRCLLDKGLALWRGPPLQDVSLEGFVETEVRRLEDLYLGALEDMTLRSILL